MSWKLQLFPAVVVLAILAFANGYAVAQTSNEAPQDDATVIARFLEYERQLNAMLKTRRDEEKLFVAQVVNQIRLQKIPSKLVTTSFEWVRNKRPDTKYPFVYFERVLRLQAGKLNLGDEIPDFDYAIYSQLADPNTRLPSVPDEGLSSDNTSTERTGGFDFVRRAIARVVPIEAGASEAPNSDGTESEREGIFRFGGLLNRLRR